MSERPPQPIDAAARLNGNACIRLIKTNICSSVCDIKNKQRCENIFKASLFLWIDTVCKHDYNLIDRASAATSSQFQLGPETFRMSGYSPAAVLRYRDYFSKSCESLYARLLLNKIDRIDYNSHIAPNN
jgi:hypothetical protein